MNVTKPLVINGWNIFGHSLFLDQLESLIKEVELLSQKDINFKKKNVTKRLAAIFKLAFEIIPQDPTLPEYRQGITLGDTYKHWFRAKFFQQYRLFFRYHSASKVIVYTWVNDDSNKRAYNSKTDAYLTFKKMLNNGYPPNNWEQLIKEAKLETNRLNKIVSNLDKIKP
ncbi:MAG: type II toxin-antitoxin system YhaV family toxin [Desulfobacterales bacterium]|nr:type II toxin-antitoxin system YhaV family toxin [Desulfobacterales bacterium]